jgi:hypothetical protein
VIKARKPTIKTHAAAALTRLVAVAALFNQREIMNILVEFVAGVAGFLIMWALLFLLFLL